MALVRYGGGIVDMRGSIAGTTASRNKAGAHLKARIMGNNPRSSSQGGARSIMGRLNTAWKDMDDADRSSWATFAAANPVFNKIGNQIILSGQQMFIKFNGANLHAHYPIVTTAPVAPVVDSPTSLTMTVDLTGAHTILINLSGPSLHAGEHAYIYLSPLLSPGVSYVSSLLRFMGIEAYNSTVNLTSKWRKQFGTVPHIAGVRIFARAAVLQPSTGLLSPFIQSSVLTT